MIKIFNANDRDFSTAGNIIIKPIKCNEIKKKSLNGWYIEVEVPIKYKDYISKDKLCVVKTKSKLNPQAFRIGEEINYTTRKIKFKAEHVMFDAKDYTLIDVRPTNQNGLNTLNYINQRTDDTSPFTIYSNVENINTAYFIRKNLLEAWAIIEERWGGVFDADNWNISFLTSVGNDNGETIAYGKNMQGFDIFEDWSSVCTKLCPVGYDGLMLPEQFLTSDVQYEKQYTRIIDFQTDLEGEEQTEENLLAELRKKAEDYLEENKVPKVSYTIVSNINGNLEIGDTIKVLHPFVNIFTEVLEYEYNLISEKVVSLTFGNYSRDVKTKFENIKNTIEQVNQAISKQEVVINNQTNLINSLNKNGYVYIDENEILLLDAIPKEKAKNVWRFGLAGIGFSSNGYEGPFEVAITMDGQINADFITTGTMSVSRIEGLANFISETEKQIAEIEIEQGNITSRVSSVETGVNNITNTQGEAEGKNIHIEDSAEEPFVEVELYGESIQEGTPTPDSPSEIENLEGKNKLQNKQTTQTINGVTFTVNKDKSITLSGTATANILFYLNDSNLYTEDIKEGTYAFSGCKGGSSSTYFLALELETANSSGSKYFNLTETNIGSKGFLPVKINSQNKYRTYIYVKSGATVDTTIYPQLEEGTVATPYVPYNSLEFKVEGKNIANLSVAGTQFRTTTELLQPNIVKNIKTSSNAVAYSQVKLNNLEIGEKYTVWVDIESTSKVNARICLWKDYDATKTYVNNVTKLATFKATQELLILGLYPSEELIKGLETTFKIMIIKGTYTEETIGEYKEYKSQVVYFPLEEGQKLMEGSYTGEDGIHNARKQVIFDGSDDEGWALLSGQTGIFYKILSDAKHYFTALSSHYTYTTKSIANLSVNEFTTRAGAGYAIWIKAEYETLEEFISNLAQKPTTFEYDLAEPEVVPYTEEQQEARNKIKALMTYKNITNITSDAYAKVIYMRDNGLDVYETKQNAQKRYTETSEKFTEQKMTVDGVITQVSDITSKTDELSGEVKTINSEISTVKQTIEGWSSELKNTGGNNIFYYSLDFWDNSNGLEEYSDTEIMQNSIGQTGYVLNNGSTKQTQSVKNGFYTCSFNYKKLLELAVCQVKINDTIYDLTETDWAEFEQAFEVKTNKIEIEFISDTDKSLYISDLMVNVGTTKLSWSQNANETRTDTVTIGKGIQVNSSAKNTYHRIDADGNRTFNKTTGKVVNEATDKGTETEELVVRGQAKITGLLIQKVSDQVWINSLL